MQSDSALRHVLMWSGALPSMHAKITKPRHNWSSRSPSAPTKLLSTTSAVDKHGHLVWVLRFPPGTLGLLQLNCTVSLRTVASTPGYSQAQRA